MFAHVGSLFMMLCCSASGLLRSYTQPVCLLTNTGDMLTPTTVLPNRVEWNQTVNQTPRIQRRPTLHQHSSSRRRGDLIASSCTIITLSSSSDIPSTASPQLVQFLSELLQIYQGSSSMEFKMNLELCAPLYALCTFSTSGLKAPYVKSLTHLLN